MSRRSVPIVILGGALATGCGCKTVLRWRLDPAQRTLVVGESFTPTMQFLGCGGTEPLNDVIVWHATDTTIVRVDSLSGRTTGRRVGATDVFPTGRLYGTAGAVRVVVRDP